MSEAPKKIWITEDQFWWDSIVPGEPTDALTEYVRADIVEELVKKLEIALNVFRTYQAYHEYRDAFDKADRNKGYADQMEAALKLLKEE